jgi:hypothetical protein
MSKATSHPHHIVVEAKAIVIKEYFGNVATCKADFLLTTLRATKRKSDVVSLACV